MRKVLASECVPEFREVLDAIELATTLLDSYACREIHSKLTDLISLGVDQLRRDLGGRVPYPVELEPSVLHEEQEVLAPEPTTAANSTISVGATVIIRKPADVDEYPSWESGMDFADGVVAKVEGRLASGCVCLTSDDKSLAGKLGSWSFSSKWLEPVVPKTPDEIKPHGFSHGQVVRVWLPEDASEMKLDSGMFWVEAMRPGHGNVAVVTLVDADGSFNLEFIGFPRELQDKLSEYWWSPDWCTLEAPDLETYNRSRQ